MGLLLLVSTGIIANIGNVELCGVNAWLLGSRCNAHRVSQLDRLLFVFIGARGTHCFLCFLSYCYGTPQLRYYRLTDCPSVIGRIPYLSHIIHAFC